jgi:hypothetical protein
MKLKYAPGLVALIAGMAALPVASQAAPQSCTAGKPTPASYTWNFHAEASRLLSGIQVDAAKAHDRAAKLDVYTLDSNVDWRLHANQLDALKREVDDMGQRLCRLEQIRHVAAPWQQKAIDDAAASVRLMADNVQEAIEFLNEYQANFWEPGYRHNVSNVLHESGQLSRSVQNLEQYATVHREDLQLQKELGIGGKS